MLARTRAAVVAGALLATTVPFTAGAVSSHLTCGPKQTGRWEQIPIRPFQPVSGINTTDTVTAYTVDPVVPWDVAVTNGARIQVSNSNGCDWTALNYALNAFPSQSQPFVGGVSSIVSVGLLQGTVLAAVQEGGGASSRPHIMRFANGAWSASDSGLPQAGAPRLLRAGGDGHTAYLTISPTDTGGTDTGNGGPLPQLPPLPVSVPPVDGGNGSQPTGLLYASSDGGATWALRTSADQIPGGGSGFSTLTVDPHNSNWLYGIVAGKLWISRDGGQTFATSSSGGFTAVTPLFYGEFAAFDGNGHGYYGFDPVRTLRAFKAPKGITSAAYRQGDDGVMVESNGVLRLTRPFLGVFSDAPSPVPARPGTLLGDVSAASTFHALAGHSLLRYVDPAPKHLEAPNIPPGDRSVTPPVPGTVTPGNRDVTLNIGQSATENFTLQLPKNPTPLDLFFLIDVSTSMTSYIDNLKYNLHRLVDRLTALHVDLKVGVGTLGTWPAKGEPPYPDSYAYPPAVDPNTGKVYPGPTYVKPRIYQLIRAIGDTGASLNKAINSVRLETDPPSDPQQSGNYHEGQLLALEQMVTGSGLRSEQDDQAHLPTYDAVAPGQDARWRGNPDVRRIVVVASDEAFDAPYGTPQKPGSSPQTGHPILDFTRTLRILNRAHVGVFGITAGSQDSIPDMTTLAVGTHMFSPPGGVSCGGDPLQILPAGAPLVCSQDGDFTSIIGQVLAKLQDRQNVYLVPHNGSPVLIGLNGSDLLGLDVRQANLAHFSVTVSCANVAPGTYEQAIDATLRQYVVGRAVMKVTCVAPLAAVPPLPIPPIVPQVKAAIQPPVPPPAPPPAAQPQPQPQPNVNPLTAGVTQEQQEAQLALAMQEAARQEEPETGEQMAMVDNRKREPVQALGLLLFAMAACAGLGLATLRARTAPEVRRAR